MSGFCISVTVALIAVFLVMLAVIVHLVRLNTEMDERIESDFWKIRELESKKPERD